jgi:3alpha(or 20beta)-hydroxysteroid dehydrogenase
MLTSLAGKRFVITGAANGIGAEVVKKAAAAGAIGLILDLVTPSDEAVPDGWSSQIADVMDSDSLSQAVASWCIESGAVDVVIANAGVVPSWGGISEQTSANWDRIFDINVRGVLFTLQAAIPHLAQDSSIVVTASMNSWKADGNISSYVASKHAVAGLVKSAAQDLGRQGIRVNAVAPGPIATQALLGRVASRNPGRPLPELLSIMGEQTALKRLATVENVANTVLFLASELSSGITGQVIPVDCGVL